MKPEMLTVVLDSIKNLVELINDDTDIDGRIDSIRVDDWMYSVVVSAKVTRPRLGTGPSFYKYSMLIDKDTLQVVCDGL